jgi:hypothetical protein
MIRRFQLLALVLCTTAGMAWPVEVAAQRHAPRTAHRGGTVHRGATVGVAVPRAYPPRHYRSYGRSPYYYRAYPRHYAYSPWYYTPYYSGFGFSFGFGWPGAVWGGFGYGYPYRYAYTYAYGSPYGYQYPPTVYVSPALNPPQVVERDQRPSYSTGEQGGFGTLSIRVSPSDAVILIDGEVWERSQGDNRFSIELAEGVHQIEIRKEGYGSYARTIDVYRGRVSTLNVGLTPRGAVAKPTSHVVVRQR